jgi:CO/xanthine dehydrogenase FAD-binding subunit
MRGFQYHRPSTLAEASRLLVEIPGARILAGGTDLLVKMRDGKLRPPALISLRDIAGLSGIELGERIRLGALTLVGDLVRSAELARACPALVFAARQLGSAQIRNLATVGGNLCNASPCADLAPPLLVHDARVRIAGPGGERELPLDDFFLSPGETRLGPGELLTEVSFAPPPAESRARFDKRGRTAMDIAIASIAVRLELEGDHARRARVAAGSVGPRPLRLAGVEAVLEHRRLTDAVIAEARAEIMREVRPISDIRASADYRRTLAGVLGERALRALLAEGAATC